MCPIRTFHFKTPPVLVWVLFLVPVMFPTPGLSQSQAVSFKMGYSDFRFDQVTQSFKTPDGGAVQLVQDALSGTSGIGIDFLQFSTNGHFMLSVSADYRSANLFGSSGSFTMQYAPQELGTDPDWGTRPEVEVRDQTSYFRTTIGVGLSPISDRGILLFLTPNIDVQYGHLVHLEDAYQAFLDNGFSQPGDFRVDRSLLVGGGARLNAGMWLGSRIGLVFSPGVVWSYRFDEAFQGYTYLGAEPKGWSFGYEFSFGLMSASSP